jgi:hypothetical protein
MCRCVLPRRGVLLPYMDAQQKSWMLHAFKHMLRTWLHSLEDTYKK